MKNENIIDGMSIHRRIGLVVKRIKYQFHDGPEDKLMFYIVRQAIFDLFMNKTITHTDKISAKNYLRGRMIHAELAGVDSEWVRSSLRKCGLSVD